MSVFGIFLVRVFPHANWIRRLTEQIGLNTGTFCTVSISEVFCKKLLYKFRKISTKTYMTVLNFLEVASSEAVVRTHIWEITIWWTYIELSWKHNDILQCQELYNLTAPGTLEQCCLMHFSLSDRLPWFWERTI